MKEFLPIFEKNIVRRSRQRKECWIYLATVPKRGQHSLHFDDIGTKMCRDGNGEIGRFELFSGYL